MAKIAAMKPGEVRGCPLSYLAASCCQRHNSESLIRILVCGFLFSCFGFRVGHLQVTMQTGTAQSGCRMLRFSPRVDCVDPWRPFHMFISH